MVSALLKYPYCSSQFALQKLEKGIDTNRLSLGCKSVGVSWPWNSVSVHEKKRSLVFLSLSHTCGCWENCVIPDQLVSGCGVSPKENAAEKTL